LALQDIPLPLGLSNVLMTLYVAMSAAAMSNRVLLLGGLPHSATSYEGLLDMPRMRESLRGLNMVWATEREVHTDGALQALIAAAGPAQPFPELPADIPFHGVPWLEMDMYLMGGDRMMNPWPEFGVRYRNARLQAMRNTSHVGHLTLPIADSDATQNIGLGFVPLKQNLPFGLRFFFRHTVFHRRIRETAQRLMSAIRRRGVTRLMVVHLRIEWDGPVADQPSSPEFLRTAFASQMGKLATNAGIDGIYIVCGDMTKEHEAALRSFTAVPVMFKFDFPDVVFPVKNDEKGKQNPLASAVHALVAAHSSLYVSTTTHSTFLNLVSAKRCRPPLEMTKLTRRRFEEIYALRFRSKPGAPGRYAGASPLVDPAPGVGLPDAAIPAGGFPVPDPAVHFNATRDGRGFGRNFLHWQNYGGYKEYVCPAA
jgi:hypothetical protein